MADETQVLAIELVQIEADPSQPRKFFDKEGLRRLADSMGSQGLLQPISVRTIEGGYRIIAGERRFRAAQLLEWNTITAIVRDDLTHAEAVKMQLLENVVRVDMKPLEEYRAYQSMIDGGYTVEEIADAVGKQAWAITWHLQILDAEPEVLDLFDKGILRATETRSMSSLSRAGQLRVMGKLGTNALTSKEALAYINALRAAESQGTMFADSEITISPKQRQIRKVRKSALGKLAEGVGQLYDILNKEDESELRESVVAEADLIGKQIAESRKALDMLENLLP